MNARRQRTIHEYTGGGVRPVAWDDMHVLATALSARFDPPLEHLTWASDAISLEYTYREDDADAAAPRSSVVVTLLSRGAMRLRRGRECEHVDVHFARAHSEVELERTAATLASAVRRFTMRV